MNLLSNSFCCILKINFIEDTMKNNISLDFIKNTILNSSNFEHWDSELNQFGEPDESGSFEFELTDTDGRLWGGRFLKSENGFQLVEFFSKIFYSDVSFDQLTELEMMSPDEIQNQEFDEFSNLEL